MLLFSTHILTLLKMRYIIPISIEKVIVEIIIYQKKVFGIQIVYMVFFDD